MYFVLTFAFLRPYPMPCISEFTNKYIVYLFLICLRYCPNASVVMKLLYVGSKHFIAYCVSNTRLKTM